MSTGRRDERGVVIGLYALSIVAMLLMVALVLDLGQLRVDRRYNKAVADMAVRAGVGRLQFGPWSGVCKARDYLLANSRAFSSFDAGSLVWSNAAAPAVVRLTDPCAATLSAPDAVPCLPNDRSTWSRLQATALGGRYTVEIQAGYSLSDPRFPEGPVSAAEPAAQEQASCENLAVIVTQRRSPFFAGVAGFGAITTTVRSVGRLNARETIDYVAALQLLERSRCGVLQTGGTNTRIVARPSGTHPGIIQVDSAADADSCPQPVVNAQATSSGPSVVACNASSTRPECAGGTGERRGRVGVYALNFSRPPGYIATPYPSTYGETQAVATPRTGRRFADRRYRASVAALDAEAKATLTGNGGLPPGCVTIVASSCSGNGLTWLVLQPTDCRDLGLFFSVAGRPAAPNIWFNCDLELRTALTLSAANSRVVVTGSLNVRSILTISDPRTVFVGGKSTGNRIGLDEGGGTLRVNTGSAASCKDRTGAGHATRMVIGVGSFNVASGSTMQLCQTFVYLASGYDKVPTTDATPPCSSPCSGYTGTLNFSSGSSLDWSAPNEITGRLPEAAELATTNRFEDLALWTEAGGNGNGLTGGATTNLAGVYFLPNADSFNLAGGGSLPIYLSAQFIAMTIKVTGGATMNLVPTPQDSIPVTVYSTLLVR